MSPFKVIGTELWRRYFKSYDKNCQVYCISGFACTIPRKSIYCKNLVFKLKADQMQLFNILIDMKNKRKGSKVKQDNFYLICL